MCYDFPGSQILEIREDLREIREDLRDCIFGRSEILRFSEGPGFSDFPGRSGTLRFSEDPDSEIFQEDPDSEIFREDPDSEYFGVLRLDYGSCKHPSRIFPNGCSLVKYVISI